MSNGRKAALILVAVAGVAAVTYFGFLGESPNPGNKRPSVPATASQGPTVAFGQRRERRYADFVQAAISEIQFSPDMRATYAKYRSYSDSSGEIAFRLHLALDECIHFADKSVDQISREMIVGKAVVQSAPRRLLIERQVQRCKGFNGDSGSVTAAAMEQWRRSAESGNPGAVAWMLATRPPTEQLDAVAIRLLSGNVDDAVIWGIFNYLSTRNGDAWTYQFGDPAIAIAAWALLRCSYGAPCDDRSPFVFSACVYHAACDQHDVESALPFLYPSLTPERLQEAVRVQALLASYIQNRDWARLGFYENEGTK